MVGSQSVLVVEPADDRGGVTDTLRRKGVSVETAGDAPRGLAAIEANHHALVLVDSATPGLDPALLVEALRDLAPRPVVLVIIDGPETPRGFAPDVIHGYVRRANPEQLAELVRDCLTALCGTGSQPVRSSELSLRLPQ